MTSHDSAPVLVGAAQLLQKDVNPREALSPLGMLERVSRDAAEDAGLQALDAIDCVAIINSFPWRTPNPPRAVADALGIRPSRELHTAIGGEMPIALLNHLARDIADGRARVALIAGTNNLRTLARARAERVELDWATKSVGEPTPFGERTRGASDGEERVGLALPPDIYPIFENALRARRGLSLEAHRQKIGELFTRFSEVASHNPYAWFPKVRGADEIARVTPDNRMIAYPYTKYMNAILATDQAAALLLTSAGEARAMGIAEDRWVYWWGGAHAYETAWYTSERPRFDESRAMARALHGALDEANTRVDEIDFFDLYSCFPVAVEIACEVLDLSEDDPRGQTLTGGLPYAGGPGNNYTTHSVAAAVARLRDKPSARALVTGNGWYLTKHAAAVLASAPPSGAVDGAPREAVADTSGETPIAVRDDAEGPAVIDSYTVQFDREGAPSRGIVIGRLEEGGRFLANTPDDLGSLEALLAEEGVGRRGRARRAADGVRFELL